MGAGLGGAQGAGEGEGGEDRVTKAILGGGLGAGVGGAIPVLGAGAQKLVQSRLGRAVTENVVSPASRAIGSIFSGGAAPRSLSAAAPDGAAGNVFTNFADQTQNVAETGAKSDRLATALQGGKLRRLRQIESMNSASWATKP